MIFGHYMKSIWTCELFSVLNWHNIKRKEPQNWIVILTIFIIFLVTYNDYSYMMLLFLTCIIIELRLACIVKYFLNRLYLSFQSFHLLCYTDSYFSFSAAAAEIEVVPAPSSSRPRTAQALMGKELKEKEDKQKHRKVIEKATGTGLPPVKKPKPTKSTHGVAR